MHSIWVNPRYHEEVVAMVFEERTAKEKAIEQRDILDSQVERMAQVVQSGTRENVRLHRLVEAQQALLDQMSRDLEVARTQSRIHTQTERERDEQMNSSGCEYHTSRCSCADAETRAVDDDASEWAKSAADDIQRESPRADSNPPDVGTRPYNPNRDDERFPLNPRRERMGYPTLPAEDDPSDGA